MIFNLCQANHFVHRPSPVLPMIWKPAFRMAWELSKPWHKPIFGTWADELGDENASINISHVYEDLSDEELNYAEEDLYYWLEDRGFQFNHGVVP